MIMKFTITVEEFTTIEECISYRIGKRKQYGLPTKRYTEVLNRLEKQYINSIENENKSTR